jgi:hypothetical protein
MSTVVRIRVNLGETLTPRTRLPFMAGQSHMDPISVMRCCWQSENPPSPLEDIASILTRLSPPFAGANGPPSLFELRRVLLEVLRSCGAAKEEGGGEQRESAARRTGRSRDLEYAPSVSLTAFARHLPHAFARGRKTVV